jgi:hypothetical protein
MRSGIFHRTFGLHNPDLAEPADNDVRYMQMVDGKLHSSAENSSSSEGKSGEERLQSPLSR